MPTTKNSKKKNLFVKGTSGNPSGRPPGSRNRSTLMMESILEGDAQEITRTLVETAKAGNIQAIGLCMERLMPPGRDRLVRFDLPPMQSVDDIQLVIASILAAVSEGKITPQEGVVISQIVTQQANVIFAIDVDRRLKKMEAMLGQPMAPDVPNLTTVQ